MQPGQTPYPGYGPGGNVVAGAAPSSGPYAVPPQGGVGQGIPLPELKWSGLKTGGQYKSPLNKFIGRMDSYALDTQAAYGLRIVLRFSQLQVLETTAPWPWATADISVKYSDSENSGWGKLVKSAKDLGLAIQAATLQEAMNDLVGKIFEMHQSVNEHFGEDKEGKAMLGDVWRFVRILQMGGFQQPAYGTPSVPAAPPTPAMTTPPAAQQVPAPTPQVDMTPQPTDTAAMRAKKLLHGKRLNEFLGVALIDPVIKADAAFVNSIFDQSFIVGLKASGQVALDTNTGVFTVVK